MEQMSEDCLSLYRNDHVIKGHDTEALAHLGAITLHSCAIQRLGDSNYMYMLL